MGIVEILKNTRSYACSSVLLSAAVAARRLAILCVIPVVLVGALTLRSDLEFVVALVLPFGTQTLPQTSKHAAEGSRQQRRRKDKRDGLVGAQRLELWLIPVHAKYRRLYKHSTTGVVPSAGGAPLVLFASS